MLTISRFHAAYHVPQGAPDRDRLRGRLDRLVQERLPSIIEAEFGKGPADRDAVYVVRKLHLSLWLDALAMEDGDVADRWGRLVAGALVRAILYGNGDNVRRFEDGADYLAAFLGDLSAGTAWAQWPYEEFRPLEGLSAGQAAGHLLAARPALIVRVAERLAMAGRFERLLESLSEQDAALVWERGLGFGDMQGKGLPADVATIIGDGTPGWLIGGGTIGFRRRRLAAYLSLTVKRGRYEPDEAVAVVAHGLARLQELMAARSAPQVWRALAAGEIESPAAIAGFLAGLSSGSAPARDWLVSQLSAPDGPTNVAHLARALRPESTVAPAPSTAPGRTVQHVGSAFAGLALLLPAVRDLGIYEHGGRDAVYQALLGAVGPDYTPLAIGDAGPQLLAGIEPHDAERARRGVLIWPDGLATKSATAGPRDAGYPPVALEVLRRFAGRLRGFEASSPEYLGRQLLRLPGRLELGEESLVVTLHEAPLGMVLQMNGLTGSQGRFAWLDGRELVIELPGVTP